MAYQRCSSAPQLVVRLGGSGLVENVVEVSTEKSHATPDPPCRAPLVRMTWQLDSVFSVVVKSTVDPASAAAWVESSARISYTRNRCHGS